MENIESLITAFKEYRDMLVPITTNLKEFADTYEMLKGDIEKLNAAFDGSVTSGLDKIYKSLSTEASKAANLSGEIDAFLARSEKYAEGVSRLGNSLGKLDETLTNINRLEGEAETQIGKLSAVMEEKRKNYNIKDLERTIDGYNAGVQRVSEFINKDVAEALSQNRDTLNGIRQRCDDLGSNISKEGNSVADLAAKFGETNELLRKMTDGEKVNEEYIYTILDRWAEDRGVKRKK